MRQNGHVQIIGTSRAITEMKAEIERVARSDAVAWLWKDSGFQMLAIDHEEPEAGLARIKRLKPTTLLGIRGGHL